MPNFKEYAAYYDLLNQDKNYVAECSYVLDLVEKYDAKVESILDYGCGTGKHSIQFATLGYWVTGLDLSKEMIDIANSNLNHNNEVHKEKVKFSSIEESLGSKSNENDLTVSLFHVSNYLVTSNDFNSYLENLGRNTVKGGLVIFDYWYEPAVKYLKPELRIREFENSALKITRIARPEYESFEIISICFTIFVEDKNTNEIYKIEEVHKMRPLNLEDIKGTLPKNMELLDTFAWNTFREPTKNDWSAVSVFRKN